MEVGFTVYDKKGGTNQVVIEMSNNASIPQVGDDLIYDDMICIIEKRDFQISSNDKSYAWSFSAREK